MVIFVTHVQPGRIVLELQTTTDNDAKGFDFIPEFLPPIGKFEYATFYSERADSILGVTDDESEHVLMRDGVPPIATIHIFERK